MFHLLDYLFWNEFWKKKKKGGEENMQRYQKYASGKP